MRRQTTTFITSLLTIILVAGAAFFGTRWLSANVLSKDVVSGVSMEDTLHDGDRLYSLQHKDIKRSDVVVVNAPDRINTLYIKRVIGMPGDHVAMKNDQLYINGKKQSEPYLDKDFKKKAIEEAATQRNVPADQMTFTDNFDIATWPSTKQATVPAGHYFVMGDNRLNSHDSRAFGFISKDQIQSVVVWRYWPLTKMKMF